MPDKLDTALAELSTRAPDRRLDDLSALVWRRIDAQSESAGGVWALRASALALVLMSGAVVSGTAGARPAQVFAPFSVAADLAPSTLLADVK